VMSTQTPEKLDWFPFYFQRFKASEAWKLPDYQWCWYMKLLIESADSPLPGYLPGSLDKLWRLAGAKSEHYFAKWGGPELVSRLFCRTEIEGQTWIYNKRMLQVIHQQDRKLTRRRSRNTISLSLSIQEIPDWIPHDVFHEYVQMREKIKKPMTGNAIKLAYRKLEKLKAEGHDPTAVLEQSIFRSWAGLFPLEQVGNGLRGPGRTDMAGAPRNGASGPPAKASNIDPKCPTCKGLGFTLAAGKASPCPCRKRNATNGTSERCGDERQSADASNASRDFKSAGANDR